MSDNGGNRAAEADEEEQAEAVDNDVAMEVCGTTLEISGMNMRPPIGFITGVNARSCVKLSQGNDTVQEVVINLFQDFYRDHKTLLVLQEVVGNLESLQRLTIHQKYGYGRGNVDDYSEAVESLYWQAFAGVLGGVRHPIEVRLDGEYRDDETLYDFAAFTAAMQGVSTIRSFHSSERAVTWEASDTLMSALASLPSLESVTLESFYCGNHPSNCNFPGLTDLLVSSSLRSVKFSKIRFTCGLSQALLDAFKQGSFVTDLRFTDCNCVRGGDGNDVEEDEAEIAIIRAVVQALQINSSVKCLSLIGNDFDGLLCDGVTTALLVNTTLVDLTLHVRPQYGGRWLQPLFVAMRINTSIESLDVNGFRFTDKFVCGCLRDALAQNSNLESLSLYSPVGLDETSLASWCKTLPFIRDNATLKSLTISFNGDAFNPHNATFCFDTVTMLGGNTTLECLVIKSSGIKPDAYFAALQSLQLSSALKTLRLSPVLALMGEQGMNQVVSLVKKNCSLAVLDEGLSELDKTGELGTLLRLNQAGRRYAVSTAQGVEVLIGVNDDLGCLFYHLLENPTLCEVEQHYHVNSGTGPFSKRQRI
jgi:hypothetical protein